jgi:hypothetical protein
MIRAHADCREVCILTREATEDVLKHREEHSVRCRCRRIANTKTFVVQGTMS